MQDSLIIAQLLIFLSLLLVASIVDIRKRIIPDSFCLLIVLTGFLNFELVNLIGVIVAAPFLVVAIAKPNEMGGGDIKLVATCGLVVGLISGIVGAIIGLTAMLIYDFIHKLIRKKKGAEISKSLPLAPFLSLGFTVAYLMNLGEKMYEYI